MHSSRHTVAVVLFTLLTARGGSHEASERPELVEEYTAFLEAQWEAHQALAQRFTSGGEVELTPQQLETLRSLGYIQ